MKHAHRMPFGAELLEGGGVRFRLWAPAMAQVRLEWSRDGARQAAAMARDDAGWHEAVIAEAAAGDRYRYVLPDGLRVPDPASRRNPEDVHGPSEVVDPNAYAWTDAAWKGRPWREAVISEIHIGTFTPEGSFAAAQARLAELADAGITVVELLPLADFPGRRGWGYDGVLPFAPDAAYGTPGELKAFVDTAHALGLMVLIDVVYNHFGPEGNYLHAYCPQFFNPAHQTPWGAAINFDGADSRTVRDFFVHNARYWVEEYRFDGLRMDAVHAIRDDSTPAIVEEICTALQQGPGRERHVHVVLENDLNEARRLLRDAQGRPIAATAQWNDDLHHAAHVLLTGETDGYYADYAEDPVGRFALALAQGFVYTGQASAFRGGEARGEPCSELPPEAFVSYLQTHDQIGNRAFGERIDALGEPAHVQAARACVLLSPHTPMLFMGEEFAARTPFLYFCDFGPELAAAVAAGRRAEFGRFAAFADEAARARIPDPNGDEAFLASKLDWNEGTRPAQALALRRTRELLAVRRTELVPHLGGRCRGGRGSAEAGLLRVAWQLDPQDGGKAPARWHLLANFDRVERRIDALPGRVVYALNARQDAAAGGAVTLAPGGVCASLEEAADA
jgi:maltooligosyltrehalose trehalohydrolase